MSSIKHRHLSRSSAHRQALLRNLVTSLIEREYISTTLAKAKEVQRFAEKLITLGKRNTNATRQRAQGIFYQPEKHLPKLFGPLRERYQNRNGGYTRLLRSEPLKPDAAPSAILSLVDGPRDMLFSLTAKAIARQREAGVKMDSATVMNLRKVTMYRAGGDEAMEAEINKFIELNRRKKTEEETGEMEWEHVNNAPGKVKWVRRDREEWERSDRPVPKWNKKRIQ